jgi:hypothetical protein
MKTKNLLLLLTLAVALFSCKEEKEEIKFDFEVSGIENIKSSVGETQIIEFKVQCTNGIAEDVTLSLTDAPYGVISSIEKDHGLPNYESSLTLVVSNQAQLGTYEITLQAASKTVTKTKKFILAIDDELAMTMTVYDATKWTYENLNGDFVEGATIKLFKDEESFHSNIAFYTTTTDKTGRAYFYNIPYGNYIYIVEKGTLSNIVQRVGQKGFVAVDIFRSNQEILVSSQPTAKVGDLRFRDLNADGKISDTDRTPYDQLGIYSHVLVKKVIWISNNQ